MNRPSSTRIPLVAKDVKLYLSNVTLANGGDVTGWFTLSLIDGWTVTDFSIHVDPAMSSGSPIPFHFNKDNSRVLTIFSAVESVFPGSSPCMDIYLSSRQSLPVSRIERVSMAGLHFFVGSQSGLSPPRSLDSLEQVAVILDGLYATLLPPYLGPPYAYADTLVSGGNLVYGDVNIPKNTLGFYDSYEFLN